MSWFNEVDPVWRKSRASGTSNCVEVAFLEEVVLVRNSRDPSTPPMEFSPGEWDAFLHGVRNGEFDRL